jgi:isochorismate hydrolase
VHGLGTTSLSSSFSPSWPCASSSAPTYRGVVQLLKDLSDLREVLELKKIPHFTTVQKAEQRLLKKGLWSGCWTRCSIAPAARA